MAFSKQHSSGLLAIKQVPRTSRISLTASPFFNRLAISVMLRSPMPKLKRSAPLSSSTLRRTASSQ